MNINTSFITNIEKNLYNINKKLIQDICNELDQSDKIDYFINKYLNKKNKQKKNKNMLNISNIKRNKSSYLFFTEEVRPKLRNKFPKDTMGQISKRLGKLWSSLTTKDKNKYEKKAIIDKERYLSEINKKVQDSFHSSSEELLAEEEINHSDSNHNNSNHSDSNHSDSNHSDSDHSDSNHSDSDHSDSDIDDNNCENSSENSSEIISEDSSNIITNYVSDKSTS